MSKLPLALEFLLPEELDTHRYSQNHLQLVFKVYLLLNSGIITDFEPTQSGEIDENEFCRTYSAVTGICRCWDTNLKLQRYSMPFTEDDKEHISHACLLECVRYTSIFDGLLDDNTVNDPEILNGILKDVPNTQREYLFTLTSITITFLEMKLQSSLFFSSTEEETKEIIH